LTLVAVLAGALALAQSGGELRLCLRADPKTFNPVAVSEDSSDAIRYLTGGVLIRANRKNQQLEGELAQSWRVLEGGRRIEFRLREGVQFSDGSPFSAEDVAFSIEAYSDPRLQSPTWDAFRAGTGRPRTTVMAGNRVSIAFPVPVAALDRLFDQVVILPKHKLGRAYREGGLREAWGLKTAPDEMAVLGAYRVAEYKSGSYVLLTRNPHYWKTDAKGRRLPYLDSIRMSIQQNTDIELLRFMRGEIDLVNSLSPDLFERLKAQRPGQAVDLGPSLDWEFLWFNQVAQAPIPGYKKAWFQSAVFRRAISSAINRSDICSVVYRSHATPAAGPVSPANRLWFNSRLRAETADPNLSLKRLAAEGFHFSGGALRDRSGNLVEFSLLTNAGNKPRERTAALIQQDLAKIGIRVNVGTMDFPSLMERMTRNYHYEACLLGITNVDVDPNGQMNIWLSSSSNHQWNPSQAKPATPWEAELDRLIQAQASEASQERRKAHFDKVQELIVEQAPFIFLVHKNALAAVSAALEGAAPSPLHPRTFWNADRILLTPALRSAR